MFTVCTCLENMFKKWHFVNICCICQVAAVSDGLFIAVFQAVQIIGIGLHHGGALL